MTLSRRCVPATLLAVAWSAAAPVAARAQFVVAGTETLDFARPESWDMEYYASLALPSGMGAPHALGAGELELVARPPSTTSANEGFLNGRLFVSYRVN